MMIVSRPSESYENALERAAAAWGIEPGYGDTWGRQHVTSPEVKQAILQALGIDTSTRETLDAALEARLCEEWQSLVPPAVVLGEAQAAEGVPLHVPAELAQATVEVEIRWESGTVERREYAVTDLPEDGRANLRGCIYVRKRIPLDPGPPLGYHDLSVTLEGRSATTRLILCPDRTYAPPGFRDGKRAAGIAVALYGLRSLRNWGCGDFTDLEAFTEWAGEDARLAFIGLNPLHAIPNRHPFNISPYLPSSIFYTNPIYLDLDRIEDFRNCPRACRLFSSSWAKTEIEALRAAEFIEYERVWALKRKGLKLAFAWFLRECRAGSARALEFRAFVEREGAQLDRFAIWSALDEFIHARHPEIWLWTDWPAGYQDPDSAATRAFAEKHWRMVLFHKYMQWQIEQQLSGAQEHARRRGLSIGLYHDLALATDRFGADLWAYRPFYVSGCRVGAPPDGFCPKGQDWSFPPPDSDHHRRTGYRLFAESIRKNCRDGGAMRMDHVMRFFRLYWIPEGMDPAHGAYVRDTYEDLLHILALESVRNRVIMIGEDLGTVTREIRCALDRFGLFGYKVLYFEKSEDKEFLRPAEYPAQALVASSTHDLPTLNGFWQFRDIEARRRAGVLKDEAGYHRALTERAREKQQILDILFELELLPDWMPRRAEYIPELTGEMHYALMGWLATAASRFLAVNQEDLFKEMDQQNLPGTTSEYPNWRHKMRFRVEELRHNLYVRDCTAMLRGWLDRTGR
jgi:4-alpha-glucanotransferase